MYKSCHRIATALGSVSVSPHETKLLYPKNALTFFIPYSPHSQTIFENSFTIVFKSKFPTKVRHGRHNRNQFQRRLQLFATKILSDYGKQWRRKGTFPKRSRQTYHVSQSSAGQGRQTIQHPLQGYENDDIVVSQNTHSIQNNSGPKTSS